jgi:hypothetical protein
LHKTSVEFISKKQCAASAKFLFVIINASPTGAALFESHHQQLAFVFLDGEDVSL